MCVLKIKSQANKIKINSVKYFVSNKLLIIN